MFVTAPDVPCPCAHALLPYSCCLYAQMLTVRRFLFLLFYICSKDAHCHATCVLYDLSQHIRHPLNARWMHRKSFMSVRRYAGSLTMLDRAMPRSGSQQH
jgi:hypothetical protein